MTRTHRRTAAATLLAALVLAVSACTDDDSGTGTDDPTTAPPSSASSAATDDPTPTDTGSASPSVTPAGGLELAEETSAVHVPTGWEAAEPLVDFASAANGPGRYDSIQLSDRPSLAGDSTLDSLATSAMETLPKGAKAERLPDVDLAGSPAYLISYTEPGFPSLNYDIATLRNGRSISIDIVLDKKTLRQDPQLVESVLASFRWLG